MESTLLLNQLARIGRGNQWNVDTVCAAMHITEAYPSIGDRLALVLGEIPSKSVKPAVVNRIKDKEWAKSLLEKWARTKGLWFENSDSIIEKNFGPMIAQGAEAKVYYKEGDPSVAKERTSIYSTTNKALEAIALHNYLFPETAMRVIGFTRDSDNLLRIVLTQPYIRCQRLATKDEIDAMVAEKGFRDNWQGQGVNYISERLALEDMHPANVFVDEMTGKPTCIDCIVKFVYLQRGQ